jgi:predicted transcriptional regulator
VRTTIELRDELRAKLLEMAGRRGEKGFSHLVEEAVDRYIA